MKNRLTTCLGILVCLFALPLSSEAQELLDVRIESFYCDSSDESAKRYPMTDYDGDLYALVKVRPASAAFHFRFGYLKCIVDRRHTGETWLYVRKGARYLTIERKGYESITDASLGMVLESGATYVLNLSYFEPEPAVVERTSLFAESMFYVQPFYQFYSPKAVGATVGVYLDNSNAEVYFCKGLEKSELLSVDNMAVCYLDRYSSMSFGGRVGYGFSFGRFRLTPQAGLDVIQIIGETPIIDKDDNKRRLSGYAFNLQVGGRLECMLINHLSVVVAPYYGFGLSKSNTCTEISKVSSIFNRWNGGFDIQVGLNLFFNIDY